MRKKTSIDIIILSYAKDDTRKNFTTETISTLMASEDTEQIHFNVLVIESNKALKPFQFEHSTTIYPRQKFGFHRYFNIGIKMTSSAYVCLCNNDLIFHKGWASEILNAMDSDPALLSAHPSLPGFKKPDNFTGDDSALKGYFGILFGWCIFAKRELFEKTGLLDENFNFWYSDQDYANTLKKHHIKNKLISNSIVGHSGSGSWDAIDEHERDELTQLPRLYFSYKWHHHSYPRYVLETMIYKLKKGRSLLNRKKASK